MKGFVEFKNILLQLSPLGSDVVLYADSNQIINKNVIYNETKYDFFQNDSYILKIYIKSNFCDPGQIYNNILQACSYCEQGTYSFFQSDLSCKICPQEAFYCEKDTVLIKQGYWRSSQKYQEILSCSPYALSCL